MQRRNIVDFRRQARSGLGGGNAAPAPPSFAGVVDDMLAAGGTPLFAGSVSHRLYSGYTGPLFRVRRSSDNAEANIGYDVATDRLDEAALAAHCGATNGFVVTLYDQSGNADDVTNSTGTQQPKIYDSATGVLKQGTLPYANFAVGSMQRWSRGDALGLSGAAAVTLSWFGRRSGVVMGRTMFMAVGSNAAGRDFTVGTEATNNDLMNFVIGVSRRNFADSPAITTMAGVVHEIAAGAQMGTSTCRQNGVALSEVSSVSPTSTINVENTAFTIGSAAAGVTPWDGDGSAWIVAGALTGPARTPLETFYAELLALT